MAFGFFFMSKASTEVIMEGDQIVQKSAMIWLVLAYLFDTIGELCASPVALSFITKLAPVKYAAFMMGAYLTVFVILTILTALRKETQISLKFQLKFR